MLNLIAPLNKKQPACLNTHDSDSDHENVSVARTSTPVKTNTATVPETTPVNSRNNHSSEQLHCDLDFLSSSSQG